MSQHQQKCASLYYKSEDLKKVLHSQSKNILKESSSWLRLNEFVEINKKLVLIDLDYAIEKKSEVDLWNVAFKEVIDGLRKEGADTKLSQFQMSNLEKTKKTEAQTSLSWFLDFASGFYVLLLQEICVTYDLDLPFLRSAGFYGVASDLETNNEANEVKKCQNVGSINYICTHCLIHMGDIARYKGQVKQAESFYKHSLTVSPASGHSYNQLALVEVSKGSNLSAVFFYIRALALKGPFPAASTNLSRMYNKIMNTDDHSNAGGRQVSVSSDDFINKFLICQAYLHSAVKLKKAKDWTNDLCSQLNELVASDSVRIKDMIKCISIMLFHLDQSAVIDETSSSQEEKFIYMVQTGLLAGFLNAFLLPVHTVKSLMDFMGLPIIKLILDWIVLNPQVLEQPGFLSRQHIWPGLAKMLNDLRIAMPKSSPVSSANLPQHFPLPEEFDLQAFLPLIESFKNYNFRQVLKGCTLDTNALKAMRAMRLLAQGQIIAHDNWSGRAVLKIDLLSNTFEANNDTVSTDLIETSFEKELNIKEDTTKELFETASVVTPEEMHEERPSSSELKAKTKTKNVAMAAILRQAATSSPSEQNIAGYKSASAGGTEEKQVTFKSPSPNFSDDSNSQPSSNISQEDLRSSNLPSYMINKSMPMMKTSVAPIRMDFSVPPPPLLHRPFLQQPMVQPTMQPPGLGGPGGPMRPPQRPAETTSPWTRPVDPVAVTATFGGPSYQLFGGNGPAWSPGLGGLGGLGGPGGPRGPGGPMMQPPPQRPSMTSQNNPQQQNFLFQPGPSALEKLLQQTPKPPQ